jgi:hypothetical protein
MMVVLIKNGGSAICQPIITWKLFNDSMPFLGSTRMGTHFGTDLEVVQQIKLNSLNSSITQCTIFTDFIDYNICQSAITRTLPYSRYLPIV